MQRHASDAIDYQQQISSGNKYSKASQNATALARGVEIQFDKSRYEMLKKNQDFISTRMALADTQLGSIHDVLVSMQEVAVRARGPALGVPGLTAVAQQARQNYEHLQNLAVAMDSNDDRYLLRMTSEARLLAPKPIVDSGSSSLTSATIASDAVFRRSGDYVIQGTADPQEMRMQIRGVDGVLRGPDGTEGSYFTGDISGMGTEDSPFTLSFRQELNGRFTHTETDANGSIVERYTYPRQPDAFLNLDITLDALPTSDTQIEFSPLAVTVDLDRSARIYTSGDFSVRLTFNGSNYGAEVWANDEFIKSVDLGESIGLEGESTTLALNFGDHESLPAFFNDLTLTLIGDPTKLSWGEPSTFNAETTTWSLPLVDDADAMTFRVEENVKRIEIEPGVWVPEGISFREAFGNAYDFNAERSRDVLRDALLFVESLERSAKAGALESGFIDRQNDIIQSTDQIMQYRMRAGAIDAQNDLAKAALETKVTELEAHKGRLLDTDVAEASAGLVRAQSLLEAARSIFSRLESSNLFNRLG
jgi:flagellin-like hook-associated protein FlgL